MTRTIWLVLLCWVAVNANAVPLYVADSLPTSQGWSFLALNGPQILPQASLASLNAGNFMTLDTTAANPIQGGYGRIAPLLDSAPGFRLDFSARLIGESHVNNDRAGFSLIAIDDTKHGVELAFWQDHIWVQNAGFTHGSDVAFTTASMTDYSLLVAGNTFELLANGTALLSGTTQSYTTGGPFGFVYQTPNFVFFGDDTTSASARFDLQSMSLQAVPEPSLPALLVAGIALLAVFHGRRRSTSRLT